MTSFYVSDGWQITGLLEQVRVTLQFIQYWFRILTRKGHSREKHATSSHRSVTAGAKKKCKDGRDGSCKNKAEKSKKILQNSSYLPGEQTEMLYLCFILHVSVPLWCQAGLSLFHTLHQFETLKGQQTLTFFNLSNRPTVFCWGHVRKAIFYFNLRKVGPTWDHIP